MSLTSSAIQPTNNKLKIFEPIALPTARSKAAFNEELTDTTTSGVEVPKATVVQPMTNFEISSRPANVTLPSTNLPVTQIRSTKPIEIVIQG